MSNKKPKQPKLTSEQKAQAVAIERTQRAQACAKEIKAILEKHKCSQRAQTVIDNNHIQNRIYIVAE